MATAAVSVPVGEVVADVTLVGAQLPEVEPEQLSYVHDLVVSFYEHPAATPDAASAGVLATHVGAQLHENDPRLHHYIDSVLVELVRGRTVLAVAKHIVPVTQSRLMRQLEPYITRYPTQETT